VSEDFSFFKTGKCWDTILEIGRFRLSKFITTTTFLKLVLFPSSGEQDMEGKPTLFGSLVHGASVIILFTRQQKQNQFLWF
jgi:hypothetical protein